MEIEPKISDQIHAGFSRIIGQENNKKTIQVMIEAAFLRNETLGSILLCGPENSGKSTFARAIAIAADKRFKRVSANNADTIFSQDSLSAYSVYDGKVLYIIENLQNAKKEFVDEILSPVLNDHSISIKLGKKGIARIIDFDLSDLAIVATITDKKLIPASLLYGFDLVCEMEPYSINDIITYIQSLSTEYNLSFTPDALQYIADACDNQIGKAQKLFMRIRDFSQIEGKDEISLDYAKEKLQLILPN